MKKTIITVLKFLKEYVEIEAIEQTKDNQILPIFNNAINSSTSDYEKKLFIKESKVNIEKLVGGKITEMMILISSYFEANLNTNIYSFELNKRKEFTKQNLSYYDEIIATNIDLKEKKIIKSTLNKVVELENNKLRIIKTISTINADFYNKLTEYTSQNKLNISNILLFDEMKSNNYKNDGINLFIDLNNDELKINLIKNKKLLKTENHSFGTNELHKKLSLKYSLSPRNAYYITENAFNDIYANTYTMSLNADALNDEINNFYKCISNKITNFIMKNNLNLLNLNINFYGKSISSAMLKNYSTDLFKTNLINLLNKSNEFISDEMLGLMNCLVNSKETNDNNLSTTEIFTINTNIIRNNKINKRRLMFV